jgi:hypothetical protein
MTFILLGAFHEFEIVKLFCMQYNCQHKEFVI